MLGRPGIRESDRGGIIVLSTMQDAPLLVSGILRHGQQVYGDSRVITITGADGEATTATFAEVAARAERLAGALRRLGIGDSDRVGTFLWNNQTHQEAYLAVPAMGAVLHTLNLRLFPEQLSYVMNHAEDQVVIVDASLVPLLARVRHQLTTVKHIVVAGAADTSSLGETLDYEELLAAEAPGYDWPELDERQAAAMCYTSGTTGNPKGVLYSHRTNFLHTLVTLQHDVMGLSIQDVVLPVVPMFHANAWGLTFSCPAVGCKMVMPGMKMDGASVLELIETEGVTFSAAVPTVWQMLLAEMRATGAKFSTLKRVVIGGSAVPEALIRAFHDDYGVDVVHAWGMTETSPLGTLSTPTPEIAALPYDEQMPYKLKQGRNPMGVQLKLTDDEGRRQPHDGQTFGRLKVKGAFIVGQYFKGEGGDILDHEGYFDTGDVATIDDQGFMQITDRAKDVIKSGGEWISTIEIENIAAGHPKALLAAVIGVAHPKWDERPLLLVKLKEGQSATREEFLDYLQGKIAKWWTPDDVLFVDDIPLGATGKIDKKLIRQRMAGYVLPTAKTVTA
jgi:fatty-acyl-CoA synthase